MTITVFDKDKKNNIRQSNFLIEARYKLTTQEFRIVSVIKSMVSQEDEDFKGYRINLKDIAKIIEVTGDSLIADLKKAANGLLKKPLVIYHGGATIQMNWISSYKHEKGQSFIQIRLDPELKPYLLQIKSSYTDFELKELLSLKSFYSYRIYELMKQYHPTIPKRSFPLEELKEILGCQDSYPSYSNFRDKVLNPAILEINNNKQLKIILGFEANKIGKKVTGITFFIYERNSDSEKVIVGKKIKELDSKSGNDKKEKESKEKQANKLKTIDDVKKYFSERNYKSNPEKFFNYYEAKEWAGIKKRSAVADNWELNFKEKNPDLYKITLNSSNSDSIVTQSEPIKINNDDPMWLKLSEVLKNDFEKDIYEKWLSKLNFVDVEDGNIILATETKFLRDWIKREYSAKILSSFIQVDGSLNSIKIINIELQLS